MMNSNTIEYQMLQNEVLHNPISLQLSLTTVPDVIVSSSSGSSSPRRLTQADWLHYIGMGQVVSKWGW
jgi:hypothetical protein